MTDRGGDIYVRRCLLFPADLTKMTDLGGSTTSGRAPRTLVMTSLTCRTAFWILQTTITWQGTLATGVDTFNSDLQSQEG